MYHSTAITRPPVGEFYAYPVGQTDEPFDYGITAKVPFSLLAGALVGGALYADVRRKKMNKWTPLWLGLTAAFLVYIRPSYATEPFLLPAPTPAPVLPPADPTSGLLGVGHYR